MQTLTETSEHYSLSSWCGQVAIMHEPEGRYVRFGNGHVRTFPTEKHALSAISKLLPAHPQPQFNHGD